MRHLLLVCLLAACGPGPDGGEPATPIQQNEGSANPDWPTYEDSLGSYDAFVLGCDLEGGDTDIGCVIASFGAVQNDIDSCARSKGADDGVIEEQRTKSHTFAVEDAANAAEAEHLVRSQELRELRIEATSVLPCRVQTTKTQEIRPFLVDAWEMGGCES